MMYCKQCGNEILDNAAVCVKCGVATGIPLPAENPAKSRTSYILLGVFLGGLGIHNFYAGYTGKALAQLLTNLIIGWLIIPWIAISIWVLVEICTVVEDADGVAFS